MIRDSLCTRCFALPLPIAMDEELAEETREMQEDQREMEIELEEEMREMEEEMKQTNSMNNIESIIIDQLLANNLIKNKRKVNFLIKKGGNDSQ